MQRKIKSLIGFSIGATDVEIEEVKRFYFDDLTWTVRYLFGETGSWLDNSRVLISPQALLSPYWKNKVFSVNLTKGKIKLNANIDTERPVARQHEIGMYNYHPYYEANLQNYYGKFING